MAETTFSNVLKLEDHRYNKTIDKVYDLSDLKLLNMLKDSNGILHSSGSPCPMATKKSTKVPSNSYEEVKGKLCAHCGYRIETEIPADRTYSWNYANTNRDLAGVLSHLEALTRKRVEILEMPTSTLPKALKVLTVINDINNTRYSAGGQPQNHVFHYLQLESEIVKTWLKAFNHSVADKQGATTKRIREEYSHELLSNLVRPLIKAAKLDEVNFPKENQLIKEFQENMVTSLVNSEDVRLVKVRTMWNENQSVRHLATIYGPGVNGIVVVPVAAAARLSAISGADVASFPEGLDEEEKSSLMEIVGGLYDPDNEESAYVSLSNAVDAALAFVK